MSPPKGLPITGHPVPDARRKNLTNINVCLPELQRRIAKFRYNRRWSRQGGGVALLGTLLVVACGPRTYVPQPAPSLSPRLVAGRSDDRLARILAPVLYLQRDEPFQLLRSAAVIDTGRRIIAYHLLWSDDVHGAWLPYTKPTDEEIVWIGYDASNAPTEVWTFWHGRILHLPWNRRAVEINVQWGKHGSLPRGLRESTLPRSRTLNAFYAGAFLGLPDIWLGQLNRRGPWGFFHGYARYREFTRPVVLGPLLNAVLQAGPGSEDGLRRIFGWNYSRKRAWP